MSSIRFKLAVMMFLQFFIWGAWLPPSFPFFGAGALNFTEEQKLLLNICFPVAAIIAMFGANQFVDRNFAAEKFLAFSHLIGGLAILGFGYLSWTTFNGPGAVRPNFWLFFACMAVHCFFYVPTITVTNTLAFANLTDPQKEFGPVRLWGTIGWIAASLPFIFILLDWKKVGELQSDGNTFAYLTKMLGTSLQGAPLQQGRSWAFLTAGIASLLLAGFSLTLPHTPPKKNVGESFALLESLRLLKHPFLLVLFLCTFIDATVHDGFFVYGYSFLGDVGVPGNWIAPAMTIGQISEILTMAILGWVLKSFGWRATMIVGVLGHLIRFSLFALFPNQGMPEPYLALAVNIVHGVCYAFFFATLYIFVDAVFPKDARTSAQGLFNFLILGLGPITSRFVWEPMKRFTVPLLDAAGEPVIGATGEVVKRIDYGFVLWFPAAAALVAAVLLLLFFHPPKDLDESKVQAGH
jgi:hypothetical protein